MVKMIIFFWISIYINMYQGVVNTFLPDVVNVFITTPKLLTNFIHIWVGCNLSIIEILMLKFSNKILSYAHTRIARYLLYLIKIKFYRKIVVKFNFVHCII